MHPPVLGIDEFYQTVHVLCLELVQLAIFQQRIHRRMQPAQPFQHFGIHRIASLGFAPMWQLEFSEEDIAKLLGRVDVELMADRLIDVGFQRLQLLLQVATHAFEEFLIYEDARKLHLRQHRNQRHLNLVHQFFEALFAQLRLDVLHQSQRHVGVRACILRRQMNRRLPVPMSSLIGVMMMPSCSNACSLRPRLRRPGLSRYAPTIVSKRSPDTGTPCRASTIMSYLALCPTLPMLASAITGRSASRTSASGNWRSGSVPSGVCVCPTGM